MANDIRIDLSLRGEQPTARGLKNVGDAADKAGDGLTDMAKDAGFLDKKVGELRGGLHKLITDFDRTGDMDLLKKINVDKRELGKFSRLKSQLTDLADDAAQAGSKAGGAFGGSLLKSASTSLSGGKALLIGGLAGLVVSALPFLGATLAAAVLGGVGAGGIVGGVALAATDGRVQDEATKVADKVGKAFQSAAEPFIAPAIEAIDILGDSAVDVAGDMKKAFATIAPVLVPLTRGITGLVENALPGFIEAMESAKPVIRAIANELPEIGQALSEFFKDISEDPDGAILALKVLFSLIKVTILALGELTKWLSKAFEAALPGMMLAGSALTLFASLTGGSTQKTVAFDEALRGAYDASGDFAGGLVKVGTAAGDAAADLVALNNAMDKFFGRTMDLHQATINYEDAVDNLAEAVKENGKTLDVRTEKGRAVRGAMLEEISAIKQLRDANIENGMSVANANAIYDRQLEQLRATATSLGLNKAQVNALVNAYKKLPSEAAVEVKARGLLEAIARIRELRRLLGSMVGAVNFGKPDYGSGGGRASGGPVHVGQSYVVGENGPEVLQMGNTSGYVHPNGWQPQMAKSGASNVQVIELRLSGQASGLERVFLSWLQGALRGNPGVRLTTA